MRRASTRPSPPQPRRARLRPAWHGDGDAASAGADVLVPDRARSRSCAPCCLAGRRRARLLGDSAHSAPASKLAERREECGRRAGAARCQSPAPSKAVSEEAEKSVRKFALVSRAVKNIKVTRSASEIPARFESAVIRREFCWSLRAPPLISPSQSSYTRTAIRALQSSTHAAASSFSILPHRRCPQCRIHAGSSLSVAIPTSCAPRLAGIATADPERTGMRAHSELSHPTEENELCKRRKNRRNCSAASPVARQCTTGGADKCALDGAASSVDEFREWSAVEAEHG